VPSHIIPYNEWKPLNTELGRGLIRREALDLLGFPYTETEMGNFSISGDLELVCERFPINDLGSPADFCLKRERLKSLSNLHNRPLTDIQKSVQGKSSRKEAGVKLLMPRTVCQECIQINLLRHLNILLQCRSLGIKTNLHTADILCTVRILDMKMFSQIRALHLKLPCPSSHSRTPICKTAFEAHLSFTTR
jgi:hypothetical protein